MYKRQQKWRWPNSVQRAWRPVVRSRGAGGRVPAVRRLARSEQLPCGSTACLGGEWPSTLGTLRLTELRNRLYFCNRLLGTPNETSDDGPNGLQFAQHEPAVDERTWCLVVEPMQLDPPAACGGPFRRANTRSVFSRSVAYHTVYSTNEARVRTGYLHVTALPTHAFNIMVHAAVRKAL